MSAACVSMGSVPSVLWSSRAHAQQQLHQGPLTATPLRRMDGWTVRGQSAGSCWMSSSYLRKREVPETCLWWLLGATTLKQYYKTFTFTQQLQTRFNGKLKRDNGSCHALSAPKHLFLQWALEVLNTLDHTPATNETGLHIMETFSRLLSAVVCLLSVIMEFPYDRWLYMLLN